MKPRNSILQQRTSEDGDGNNNCFSSCTLGGSWSRLSWWALASQSDATRVCLKNVRFTGNRRAQQQWGCWSTSRYSGACFQTNSCKSEGTSVHIESVVTLHTLSQHFSRFWCHHTPRNIQVSYRAYSTDLVSQTENFLRFNWLAVAVQGSQGSNQLLDPARLFADLRQLGNLGEKLPVQKTVSIHQDIGHYQWPRHKTLELRDNWPKPHVVGPNILQHEAPPRKKVPLAVPFA